MTSYPRNHEENPRGDGIFEGLDQEYHALCGNIEIVNYLEWEKKLVSFKPTGGIRQGDAISPYLFVLCMESLGVLIQDAVKRKEWTPIKLAQNGPPLSHFFSVDDLIIFAEATTDQIRVIMKCLETFCNLSGQKVGFKKSSIFFSRKVDGQTQKEVDSRYLWNSAHK